MFASALDLAPMIGSFLSNLGMFVLYVLFFAASILLIIIVLLQEGKGGGFTAAFGGLGTEAFGVKTGGINKLTSVLAAIFVVTALVLGVATKSSQTVAEDLGPQLQQPGAFGTGPAGPGQPGEAPPTAPGQTPGQTPPPAGTTPPAPEQPTPPAPGPEKPAGQQPPAEKPPAEKPPSEKSPEKKPDAGETPAKSEPPAPEKG